MDSFSISEVFAPVQLLAWAATVIYLISYQRQTARKTIIMWAPADVLMFFHFYFMGAPYIMLTAAGGFFRSLISIYTSRKILLIYLIIYTIIIFVAYPIIGSGLRDLFVISGTCFFSLSVWYNHHFITHRLFAFAHQISWIFAFSLLESYGGLALIAVMLSSNIIGTGRYIIKQRS